MNRISQSYVSIKPSFLTTYQRVEVIGGRTLRQKENEIHLKNNKTDGLISDKANKNIRTAIDWLIELSPDKKVFQKSTKRSFSYKLGFVTLTLSSKQVHDDNTIKKTLLNQFLIEAKKKWQVNNYIWRAEAQKNGNIHFHIIVDRFIPYWELTNVWNRIQNKLGYVDCYRKKFKNLEPNSTDIHSIHKIKRLHLYFAKYLAKNSKERKINGKLWGLSYSLSQMKSLILEVTNDIIDELNEIYENFQSDVKKEEYYTLFFVSIKKWSSKVKGKLYDAYKNYIFDYVNNFKNLENLTFEF